MRSLEFGDMVFYAAVSLVLILLFWLRFLEAHVGLWGAWCVWAFWLAFLVWRYVRARRAIS
jgi:hypothetical protein